jgi:hypothetical protein
MGIPRIHLHFSLDGIKQDPTIENLPLFLFSLSEWHVNFLAGTVIRQKTISQSKLHVVGCDKMEHCPVAKAESRTRNAQTATMLLQV